MKTIKFRLLALIITLAAVTATTTNAQRRSTSDNTNSRKVENTRSGNRNSIEKKSADRVKVNESRSASRSVKNNSEVKRNNTSVKPKAKQRVSKNGDYSKNDKNRSNNQKNSNSSAQTRYEKRERVSPQSDRSRSKVSETREKSKRSREYSNENNRNRNNENINRNRNTNRSNAERYNLSSDDVRYRPTRDYKGSDKYWSSDFRNDNRNRRSNTQKFNYNKYNHWDHKWEGYRWNHNSWMNYYAGYNPYSFRNNKYYYHHNHYGHVIRKFVYRPQIFVHNHIRYYSYDGYFFRYHRGVGYVLVDMPFGMAFEYLPNNYERVYINGYMYFRVGNLFFEHTDYGFQLIYYPERYFAFNDGYRSEGFRFNDMDY